MWNAAIPTAFALTSPAICRATQGGYIMDNPGFYLVAWLLIAPVISTIFLSGLGSSRMPLRPDNSL